MVEMTGAQALVEALKREKVEAVFGLPGGANLPIYDAMFDAELRHILVRHEQCAAHMADGYARVARRPGVCMGTSGPGATNLVTGIATAHADSSPVVAITGQVPTNMIGKDAFQETDIMGIVTPITKYAFQPWTAAEIPEVIKKAFYIAGTGRPGAVLVDVPKDVQNEKADMIFPETVRFRKSIAVPHPDAVHIEKAAEFLLKAEKPVIMAGGGAIISGAFQELQALAELLVSPVVTTFKGKGSFNETHPLSLGPIGMHGHPEANKLILETDCLLAVGARFSDRSVGKWDEFNPPKTIHIDIDPAEIGKNKAADIALVGDVKEALGMLVRAVERKIVKKKDANYPWMKHVNEVKSFYRSKPLPAPREITGPRLLKKLRELIPTDTVITTEVGQHQMWASLHFDIIKPGTFFTSTGLGTMGWGLPAAVGAKVARPNVPVIDIAGDGSFQMTETTLATSVIDKIPIIAVVLNNGMLGMVAQWQRLFYNRKYIGVELNGIPDLVKVAEAYGAQGFRVQSMDEFSKAVKTALRSDVATVIDVPIDSEEDVFPFVAPGTGLKDMIIA